MARWDSRDFLEALGGYWSSNFGWRTKLTETAPNFAFVFPLNLATQNIIVTNQYQPMYASLFDYRWPQVLSVGGGGSYYRAGVARAQFLTTLDAVNDPQLDILFGVHPTQELTTEQSPRSKPVFT
jgi:hypothetical protein